MARPPSDFPPAEEIRSLADQQGRLMVKVTPGARLETMTVSDGYLLMKVRAKPTDGAANDAVLGLLARALRVPKSQLTLLRGATAREKQIQIS